MSSDYDMMMSGGGVMPETGRPAGDELDSDALQTGAGVVSTPSPTRPGAVWNQALERARALKRELSVAVTRPATPGVPATVPATQPRGLLELARLPSPLFGVPWGVVVLAGAVGAVVVWRRMR